MSDGQARRLGRTLITVSFIMIPIQNSFPSAPFALTVLAIAAAGFVFTWKGVS